MELLRLPALRDKAKRGAEGVGILCGGYQQHFAMGAEQLGRWRLEMLD